MIEGARYRGPCERCGYDKGEFMRCVSGLVTCHICERKISENRPVATPPARVLDYRSIECKACGAGVRRPCYRFGVVQASGRECPRRKVDVRKRNPSVCNPVNPKSTRFAP